VHGNLTWREMCGDEGSRLARVRRFGSFARAVAGGVRVVVSRAVSISGKTIKGRAGRLLVWAFFGPMRA
jgi:hypothetical protein